MNVQYLSNCRHPRAVVWLLLKDLEASGANAYKLKDAALAGTLGDGSEILVMDVAGMLLLWSAEKQEGYFWSSSAAPEAEK